MSEKLSGIVARIDAFSLRIGNAVAWLTLLMVIVTFAVVVLRYVFGIGLIWLQESVTWMHGAVFMLGAAYALQREEHVRVDIFYRGMSERRQAWVNIAGVILFLLPFCAYLLYQSWGYVTAAWAIRESSRDSGGLPYPFVPLLKTILLLMPVAVALQGFSMLLVSLRNIRRP